MSLDSIARTGSMLRKTEELLDSDQWDRFEIMRRLPRDQLKEMCSEAADQLDSVLERVGISPLPFTEPMRNVVIDDGMAITSIFQSLLGRMQQANEEHSAAFEALTVQQQKAEEGWAMIRAGGLVGEVIVYLLDIINIEHGEPTVTGI